MSGKRAPKHVVVDGSNIATEGRSMPSLAQLNEAVMGFMDEHPDTAITVVVDATFGHRIDKKEVPEFEAGISNNELVAPPAGAVGRGDAFVLGIADKAGSSVLSNDSFQEFHGDYEWLFDEGRLIGGKPVPHVGWVWVDRVPVRGPISRKATRGTSTSGRSRSRGRGRRDEGTARVGSAEASGPMPVPKSPPPKAASESAPKRAASRSKGEQPEAPTSTRRAPKSGDPVNELLPFLEFVEHHPVGSSIEAEVESYSSHGAYVAVAGSEVRGYVPLRMMADPTPRSAKSIMKIGDVVPLVVVSFSGGRRSIDCAVPDMAEASISAAAAEQEHDDSSPVDDKSAKPSTTKRVAVKKTATKKTASKKAATRKAAAKKPAVKKTATKKTATKKQASKKAATRKAAAKKPAVKKTATKKQASKKAATSKAAAKKPAVKKTPTKKAAATKTATRKKAAAKKTASGVRRTPVRKTPVKKQAASIEGTS